MTIPPARIITAIILALIGILGSLKLKLSNSISEPSFVIFITLSIFVGVVIFFAERIQSLSFKKMEIILKEAKETEVTIKQVADAMLDVIESKSHAIMQESYDDKVYQDAANRLRKLIA